METATKRERIEAAFGHLKILDNEEAKGRFAMLVDNLETLPSKAGPPHHFMYVGKNSTIKELEDLKKKAEALAERLASLSGYSVDALAHLGVVDFRRSMQSHSKIMADHAGRAIDLVTVPNTPTGWIFARQRTAGKRPLEPVCYLLRNGMDLGREPKKHLPFSPRRKEKE